MTEWPRLCLLLLTFDRFEYAERTLRSTLDRLHYSGPLSVHVADDGSPGDYRERLIEIAGGYAGVQGVSVSNSERRGYGANYNLALQVVHSFADVVLPLEDDWELQRPLDLDELVRVFAEADWPGCVRLGYLGFTQPLHGTVVSLAGRLYLHLTPESPEPHVWAGHPRLETRRYQRDVGPWTEGLDPGTTEFEVAHRPAARQGVLWPLDLCLPASQHGMSLFAHIGAVPAAR